jgi:amino acid permease
MFNKKLQSWMFKIGLLNLLIGAFTPALWFMSSLMDYYRQETFDITKVHFMNGLIFILLAICALCSMFSFVKLAERSDKSN